MPAKHTYSLHYFNGHFYDPETKRRVVLSDGAEVQLTGQPAAFLPFEPAGDSHTHRPPRTEDAMRQELMQDSKVGTAYLLLTAGAALRFLLHPTKPPIPGATAAEYLFNVRLAEPLFAYHRSKPGKNPDPGSLVDCDCEVYQARRTSDGYDDAPDRLRYFEPVYARSLNSLIKNTYVHYFHNAGSPGRSAFEIMFISDTSETLGELRARVVPVIAASK